MQKLKKKTSADTRATEQQTKNWPYLLWDQIIGHLLLFLSVSSTISSTFSPSSFSGTSLTISGAVCFVVSSSVHIFAGCDELKDLICYEEDLQRKESCENFIFTRKIPTVITRRRSCSLSRLFDEVDKVDLPTQDLYFSLHFRVSVVVRHWLPLADGAWTTSRVRVWTPYL